MGEIWMAYDKEGMHRWMNMAELREMDDSGCVFVYTFEWECQWVMDEMHTEVKRMCCPQHTTRCLQML